MSETFSGSCFCGRVVIRVEGPPLQTGYCHCRSCQNVHGAPFITWGAWRAKAMTIETTDDAAAEFNRTGDPSCSTRIFCKVCGARVANRRLHTKTAVVYGSTLAGSGIAFEPKMHIHYRDHVVALADGLPKYLDTPEAWGGSDEKAAEPAATRWDSL